MQKVQLTLTDQEQNLLALRAASLGYNVTKFIKLLISREAFSIVEDIPIFTLSEKAEKEALLALKEHGKRKSKELGEVNDLDNL